MVASRRLSPATVVVVTAFALVAALITLIVLDRGGSSATGERGADDIELSPEVAKLPSSVQDVTLASLDGGADRKLGELIGTKPVVVNFFGSWCAPCIREMPAFEQVHRDVGDDVAVIGMAYRDTPEDARATVRKTGVTYPTFADRDGGALTWFGGLEMPTTVFIDEAGKVVDVNRGAMTESELRAKLHDLYGIAA